MAGDRSTLRLLVIDNYDSFTYNVVQALESLGARCQVFLNDAIDVPTAMALAPDGVVISPGPCSPTEAGVSLDVIRAFAGRCPLFGVCLGHQAIAHLYGGRVVRAARPVHGKTSVIEHDGRTIYRGMKMPMLATRYNSLVADRASIPECLEISSWTAEGEIMGLRHSTLPIEGVQFHPESIISEDGLHLLGNWIAMVASGVGK